VLLKDRLEFLLDVSFELLMKSFEGIVEFGLGGHAWFLLLIAVHCTGVLWKSSSFVEPDPTF